MITIDGYSKDPGIIPEGIAVTFSQKIADFNQCSMESLIRWFKRCMNREDGIWLHRCKNKPKYDVAYVYIIVNNMVAYRVQFVAHETNTVSEVVTADVRWVEVSWPRILLTGPLVKAPFEIKRSGFRGFRYTTKLF